MFRNIAPALAIVLVFESAALSSNAFAHPIGSGGGAAGFRGDHFARTIGSVGRNEGEGAYSGFRDPRGTFRAYEPRDVWGHWGSYYGPMIHFP